MRRGLGWELRMFVNGGGREICWIKWNVYNKNMNIVFRSGVFGYVFNIYGF